MRIVKYNNTLKNEWDNFIEKSRNGIFSLKRDFVEYHQHRFTDYSLLFYHENKLIAVMPANVADNIIYSHQGLTWGGLVVGTKTTASDVIAIFQELKQYLKSVNINQLIYKAIPSIFHILNSEEDLYALHRLGGKIMKREISSVINLMEKIEFSKGNKWLLNKKTSNFKIVYSNDFELFMKTETAILENKYKTQPTHTASELHYLQLKFPDNLFLIHFFDGDTYYGGIIYYVFKKVIHTQYIGITPEGKKEGALVRGVDHLIKKFSGSHQFISFGISTENGGNYLNENLIKSKENLGARAIVHDTYVVEI